MRPELPLPGSPPPLASSLSIERVRAGTYSYVVMRSDGG